MNLKINLKMMLMILKIYLNKIISKIDKIKFIDYLIMILKIKINL